MLRRSWKFSVIALAGVTFAFGQDDVPPAPKGSAPAGTAAPASRAEQLQSLIDELEARTGKIIEALPDDATDEQRVAVQKQLNALVDATRNQVFEFAKSDPRDRSSLTAIEWLSQFPEIPEQSKVMEGWLLEFHVASPRLAGILELLEDESLTPGQIKFLEAIGEKNPFPQMKAQALLTLARSTLGQSDAFELQDADRKALRDRARKQFERIQKEFPTVETAEGSFAELAADGIYILENLSVGCRLPGVQAQELSGKPVSLSSVQGKVIVLDFWATWCGPCLQMIPHERELVKRHAEQPFALIGISVDDDRRIVSDFIAQEPLPWTQWWVGPEAKVLETLRVEMFPTIYVLDAKGIIRFKNVHDEELDKAVETLLKEAEAAK